jgi:hypothetical protein
MEILHGVREFDPYFKLKHDADGTTGFLLIQKCTAAMRMLACRAPTDAQDDYPAHEWSTVMPSRGGTLWQVLFERAN